MKFYLLPNVEDPTVEFGVPPEGATLIDAMNEEKPFEGRKLTVSAMEEVQRLHLRWWRGQSEGCRARLDGARLDGASLDGARLDGASLDGARLDGASLDGARLDGASLDGASLDGARLDGASLVRASLDGARLDGASLVRASLVRARLVRARLDGARLDGASLDGARLDPIRDDIYAVLNAMPVEVPGLLAAIEEGRINGQLYADECACLIGTLANVRGVAVEQIPVARDSSRPAEVWFMALKVGDMPGNHPVAALTARWVREWLTKRQTMVDEQSEASQS